MFGDILSDAASVLPGSLGLMPLDFEEVYASVFLSCFYHVFVLIHTYIISIYTYIVCRKIHTHIYIYIYIALYMYISIYIYMGRCLKERLQNEDKGGNIVLESIIFSLRYKAGPQGALLNPLGGARLATDRR